MDDENYNNLLIKEIKEYEEKYNEKILPDKVQ